MALVYVIFVEYTIISYIEKINVKYLNILFVYI